MRRSGPNHIQSLMPETELLVYDLLDNASHTTFITTPTLRNLGVEGPELKLKLYIIHGNTEIPVQKINGLMVERLIRHYVVLTNAIHTFVMKTLAVSRSSRCNKDIKLPWNSVDWKELPEF